MEIRTLILQLLGEQFHRKYDFLIVPFHKSQSALPHLDLMSKIRNTFKTTLSVTANEEMHDWSAPISCVSVQPIIKLLKDEVACA